MTNKYTINSYILITLFCMFAVFYGDFLERVLFNKNKDLMLETSQSPKTLSQKHQILSSVCRSHVNQVMHCGMH